jgi:hypothetical protein
MDDVLQREILKILAERGQVHWGGIRNTLNGQPAGWDVSDRDVQSALDSLFSVGKVHRQGELWSLAALN